MRKIIKHHIEGGTRESHPRVQDLLIFDDRMGFPRPSLNVVLDSISPKKGDGTTCPEGQAFPVGMPHPLQMLHGNHS